MSIQIKKTTSELMCKSGCGFFGNPSWQGYCSRCWRDNYHVNVDPSTSVSTAVVLPKVSTSTVKTFSKFEEKKKKQTDKRKETVRSIFRKYNASDIGSGQQSTSEIINSTSSSKVNQFARRNSETTIESAESLINFLHGFNRDMGKDVSKYSRYIVEQADKLCTENQNIDILSELIITHYQNYEDRVKTNSLYKGISDEQLDKLLSLTEHYICTRIYRNVFAMSSTLDEEHDLEIQGKIRKYHWISSSHLDINIDEAKDNVRNLLDEAINGIIEMDTVRPPKMKIDCITKCSQYIFKLLHESKDSPISADDFLPTLIYVVLRANPPLLKSNIMYIMRFANPSCLLTGEGAYNFTNLCCAVSFIENLTHESLSLTSQQFNAIFSNQNTNDLVDYMSGKLISYDATCRINREHISNSEKNEKKFEALQIRINSLNLHNQQLLEDMMNMKKKILSEVQEVMTNNPCDIRPTKTPIRIDDDISSETTDKLPAPLLPTTINHRK